MIPELLTSKPSPCRRSFSGAPSTFRNSRRTSEDSPFQSRALRRRNSIFAAPSPAGRVGALPRKVTHEYSDEALALAASDYESLNFEEDSITHRTVRAATTAKEKAWTERVMLLITLLLGLGLAMIREAMVVSEALLLHAMDELSAWAMWESDGGSDVAEPSLYTAYAAFVLVRLALVTVAALLTVWEPHAQHSGMPRIKSNLNGADITGFLTLRTLVTKTVAITLVVSTSLPLGKDGPMVHIGACLATLLSQNDYGFMKRFPDLKSPLAMRTWVSMGAAAGMCAAFSAPMGGILYCFEEVSTHWNRTLAWRSFLCAITVVVAARVIMELPRELCSDSQSFACKSIALHTFVHGLDQDTEYLAVSDGGLLWYALVSALGGALGALYNSSTRLINRRRQRFLHRNRARQRAVALFSLTEVLLLSFVAFSCFFLLPLVPPLYGGLGCVAADGSGTSSSSSSSSGYSASSGSPSSGSASSEHGGGHHGPSYVRYNCPEGEHNLLASLLQSGQEGVLKHLYKRSEGAGYPVDALLLLLACYFVLAVFILGVRLPLDAFIPAMIIGALGGRLAGEVLHDGQLIDGDERGTFALMGSAAVLAGVTRMPLTLSVILVEITQDVRAMPLIMACLAIAVAVASRLAEPIDDTMIQLQGMPYLHEEPPQILHDLVARDVMSPRVETLPIVCSVREALRVLQNTGHNGFPVVRPSHHRGDQKDCGVCGLILRRQLMVLLHDRAWDFLSVDRGGTGKAVGNVWRLREVQRRYVASHVTWQELREKPFEFRDEADLDCTLDLSAFMDPCPAIVFGIAPLPKVYQLFNSIGIRHLTVVDRHLQVVGIITRKDTIPELVERRLEANAATRQLRQQEAKPSRPGMGAGLSPALPSRHPRALWQQAGEKVTSHRTGVRRPRISSKVMDAAVSRLRLTYASVLETNCEVGEAHFRSSHAELVAKIVISSLKNNPSRGLGGMLFFDSRTHAIVQVLEGPELAVRALWQTILADRRHKGCAILKEERIGKSGSIRPSFGIGIKSDLLSGNAAAGGGERGGGGTSPGGSPSAATQPSKLLRLQYSSKLAASSLSCAHELLTGILAVSMRHNIANCIGGIMLFNPTDLRVRQLLEGPEHTVRDLWARIQEDTRHMDCKLVCETMIEPANCAFHDCWGVIQTETLSDLSDLLALASSLHPFQDQGAAAAAAAAAKRIADAAALQEHIEEERARDQADAHLQRPPASKGSGSRRQSLTGAVGRGVNRMMRASKEAREARASKE